MAAVLLEQEPLSDSAVQLKPPLKWAGGKRWLVPRLKLLWKNHRGRRLVEPFCGGLAVTLGLVPEIALLNDINLHAVHFYRWLQKGLQISIALKNERRLYNAHRKRFNELIALKKFGLRETSELFYYLNRTGYNGLCRFNQSGKFNVPFGRYKTINYKRDWSEYQSVLENWDFSAADFENLKIDPSDFIYADPPYDVEFTHYSKEGFDWNDQVRLAKFLARHLGPVVVSNQATKRIIALYESLNFKIELLPAPRRISCDGNRDDAMEMLAVKGV